VKKIKLFRTNELVFFRLYELLIRSCVLKSMPVVGHGIFLIWLTILQSKNTLLNKYLLYLLTYCEKKAWILDIALLTGG